jgi:peptidoglycan hydrolase-like protein with peptidoglycan-binding domain/DNA-binding XRE family transcriptional regulator
MRKAYIYNEKLKHARELRGWSQEELARRIGSLADSLGHQGVVLDVSTISRWERGRNSPSPFYRQLLCVLFEMNAEELGLLAPDNAPQLNEETGIQQEFSPPAEPSQESALPLVELYGTATYDPPLSAPVRQDETLRNLDSIKLPPEKPEPYFLVARRRHFLAALLASVTLGGGAAILFKLFFSQPRSETPTVAAISRPTTVPPQAAAAPPRLARLWPTVTPDIHKKLARVRVVQWMLNAQGRKVQVDGVFWVETENAVMFFQESMHLPVSNTVDTTTWERLILPSSIAGPLTVQRGDQVRALQEMLNMYGASPRLMVDGDFGPLTEAATKHFQQTHKLAVTGQADLNTWCVLVGGHLG